MVLCPLAGKGSPEPIIKYRVVQSYYQVLSSAISIGVMCYYQVGMQSGAAYITKYRVVPSFTRYRAVLCITSSHSFSINNAL